MAEIAAVHAANHQGFSPDDTASLSQVIKEAVMLLLNPDRPDGTMAFDFESKAGIVTVEAQLDQRGRTTDPPQQDRPIRVFGRIAGGLVEARPRRTPGLASEVDLGERPAC